MSRVLTDADELAVHKDGLTVEAVEKLIDVEPAPWATAAVWRLTPFEKLKEESPATRKNRLLLGPCWGAFLEYFSDNLYEFMNQDPPAFVIP